MLSPTSSQPGVFVIRTIGPYEWGLFHTDWCNGDVPVFRGDVWECIAERRRYL